MGIEGIIFDINLSIIYKGAVVINEKLILSSLTKIINSSNIDYI